MTRASAPWNPEQDLELLRSVMIPGAIYAEIANHLGRTVAAITNRLYELRGGADKRRARIEEQRRARTTEQIEREEVDDDHDDFLYSPGGSCYLRVPPDDPLLAALRREHGHDTICREYQTRGARDLRSVRDGDSEGSQKVSRRSAATNGGHFGG